MLQFVNLFLSTMDDTCSVVVLKASNECTKTNMASSTSD